MMDVSDAQVRGTTTVDWNPLNEMVDLKKELIRDEHQRKSSWISGCNHND